LRDIDRDQIHSGPLTYAQFAGNVVEK